MIPQAYGWLMEGGGGEPFDRHTFACAISVALTDPDQPLAMGLGLSAECLAALVGRYFPHAPMLLAGLSTDEDGMAPLSADEAPLRDLLMAHLSEGSVEEEWLAHIIARRILQPRHLWLEMGLAHGCELKNIMHRHFNTLADRNKADQRWKPFLRAQALKRGMVRPVMDVQMALSPAV